MHYVIMLPYSNVSATDGRYSLAEARVNNSAWRLTIDMTEKLSNCDHSDKMSHINITCYTILTLTNVGIFMKLICV